VLYSSHLTSALTELPSSISLPCNCITFHLLVLSSCYSLFFLMLLHSCSMATTLIKGWLITPVLYTIFTCMAYSSLKTKVAVHCTLIHTYGVGLTAGPCTMTIVHLLCILLHFNPSAILHFEWSAGFSL
jgi:hypothetical protein